MRFHRDVEYALISLSAMMQDGGVHSARKLAEQQKVPYGLLCKILQKLAAAGILDSVQGPRGGYRLVRDPDEVSLSTIIDAVHGEQHVVPCLDEGDCGRIDGCTIRDGVLMVQSMWDSMMSRMSLQDFVRESGNKRQYVEEAELA
jgi:Rrf2 family protein